jgi:hypothetical protein
MLQCNMPKLWVVQEIDHHRLQIGTLNLPTYLPSGRVGQCLRQGEFRVANMIVGLLLRLFLIDRHLDIQGRV